jgi:lipopolysaccharide/colanic/teichoic acid biosynthesis glycosyltransferase
MLDWGSQSIGSNGTDPSAAAAFGSPPTSVVSPSPLAVRWDAILKDIAGPIVALLALVVLSPLFAIIALAVKWSSPGPVFHRRRVLGGRGRAFDALKFRTMVADADGVLARNPELQLAYLVKQKLTDDPRTTRVGRFLRKYSADELPQLINVVRGQMWMIGPRMISAEELPRYGAHAPRLMTVKPGMTGLWQVSGRQETTYERRVELDMQYLDEWTLWLDVTILVRTFAVVMTGRGAY